ncbi:hypothetical protein TVAG_410900 [Trichomonas vaginalis G3]|uniref:Uncharacterized protein n=1 Tax=Trichomonas vaginalis (strain ATCC PRA-98 / G3) TaxID=412133 RepID=A2DXJ5_TRIV3|nr:hypothetical protein TVAGG3_0048090 [Trichomonas vaginalis G3]EAY14824.1 hypothetical protein TVAG_410900 [Trichomonas vaginalis G3]KAI5541195.1 hypothetical protein TVAGG3_0048090 [Trichomonas vaginalis G3]|eukprot:XP_001327047.1 hypothetical protein [Trichomonas vaginalis G3]
MKSLNLSLPADILASNSLRQILFGKIPLTYMFFNILSDEKKKEILDLILNSDLPKGFTVSEFITDENLFKWACACIGDSVYRINNNQLFQLYLHDLLLIRTKPTVEFYKQISTINKAADDGQIIKLIQSFFEFLKYYPSYARVFVETVSEYSLMIPFEQIAQAFGVTSFILLGKQGFLDVGITLESRSDYEDLFQNLTISNDILTFFQNFFVSENSFPSTSFLSATPLHSALNTAATTKVHFIEVIRALASSQFRLKNYDSCLEICNMLGELSTWTFLSFIQDENYYPTLKSITTTKNTIADEFIQRVKNDLALLDKVKRINGISINPGHFLENSLPYLLQSSLHGANAVNFDNVFDQKLYMITDIARNIDNDFVCAYFAIFIALEIVTGQYKVEESNKIENFINNIINPETKMKVLIDVFSTIFIKQGNDYICSLDAAECICMLLLNYSDDMNLVNVIQKGHNKLQSELFNSNGGDLKNCFLSTVSRVGQSLISGDFQIAYNIAQSDMKLREIIDAASEIFEFKNKKLKGFQGSNYAMMEVGFSFNDELISLQNCQVTSPLTEINLLKNDRLQKRGLAVLTAVRPIDVNFVNTIEQKCIRMTSVFWETPSVKNEKIGLLSGFFEYLDCFIPPLLQNGSTVFDALKVNRSKMVEKLLVENKLDEAMKVSKMMKFNLETVIFENDQIPFETISKFVDKEETILSAVALKRKNKELITKSKVMMEYIDSINNNSSNTTKDKLNVDEIEKYSQEELEKFLLNEISNQKFEKETFEEISFKLYDFSEIIYKNTKNRNIKQILNVLERCNINDEVYEKLLFLNKFEDPFPVEDLFKKLIREENLKDAEEMLAIFNEIKHLSWMVSELSQKQKIKIENVEEEKVTEKDRFSELKLTRNFVDFCRLVRKQYNNDKDLLAYFSKEIENRVKYLSKEEFIAGFGLIENILTTAADMKIDVYRSTLQTYPSEISFSQNTEFDISWDKLFEKPKFYNENLSVKKIFVVYNLLVKSRTIFESNLKLGDYQGKQFGEELFELCFGDDLFTFLSEIRDLWEIDIEEYKLKVFKEVRDMDLYNECLRFIPKQNKHFNAVEYFIRKPTFSKKYFETDQAASDKVLQQILDNTNPKVSSEYYVMHNDFEKALKHVKNDDLIENFVIPCIEYNKAHTMLESLSKEQNQIVLDFSIKENLLHLTLYVQQILEMNMEAAKTSISLFSMKGFGVQNFAYLDSAQAMLFKELQNKQDESVKKEIDKLIQSITYQRLFCVFCTERKLYGFSGLNVFDGIASQESVAVLLLKSGSADLGSSFIKFYELDPRQIAFKITDALVNETIETIINVFDKISEYDIYQCILCNVLTRMWYTFGEYDLVMKIINVQKNAELKALLLFQFYETNLAADVAIKNNLKDLYGMIGRRAYFEGNTSLSAKLMKLLDSKK